MAPMLFPPDHPPDVIEPLHLSSLSSNTIPLDFSNPANVVVSLCKRTAHSKLAWLEGKIKLGSHIFIGVFVLAAGIAIVLSVKADRRRRHPPRTMKEDGDLLSEINEQIKDQYGHAPGEIKNASKTPENGSKGDLKHPWYWPFTKKNGEERLSRFQRVSRRRGTRSPYPRRLSDGFKRKRSSSYSVLPDSNFAVTYPQPSLMSQDENYRDLCRGGMPEKPSRPDIPSSRRRRRRDEDELDLYHDAVRLIDRVQPRPECPPQAAKNQIKQRSTSFKIPSRDGKIAFILTPRNNSQNDSRQFKAVGSNNSSSTTLAADLTLPNVVYPANEARRAPSPDSTIGSLEDDHFNHLELDHLPSAPHPTPESTRPGTPIFRSRDSVRTFDTVFQQECFIDISGPGNPHNPHQIVTSNEARVNNIV